MKDKKWTISGILARKKKPRSINSWLMRSFILFTLLMLGSLWLLETVFLQPIYKWTKISQIQGTASSISSHLFSDDLDSRLESAVSEQQLCAMVIDSYGRVISSADTLPGCSIHRLNSLGLFTLYACATESGGSFLLEVGSNNQEDGHLHRYSAFSAGVIPVIFGKESIISVTVVSDTAGHERILLLNSVVSPVDTTVQTIRYLLIGVTVVMLLVGVLISLFLSRRIAHPIVEINHSSKGLVRGEYSPYTGSICREIQELNQTLIQVSQDLNQVEQLRRDLLANISHDLRTPLTLISGYAEVMRDLPGENTPENVQIIIDEANHLTELVNDLLDLSKLQAGVVTIQREPFCITELIQETLSRYNKMMENRGYQLTLQADQQVWVEADRTRISQVVYNLINNAIHYTGKTLDVHLRQTVSEGSVRIDVIDSGEGIPADKLALVWDRYYKLDKVHKRSAVGTGLGLSIVRSVLELHHAEYGVESEVGKGSDFWFKLPVIPPPLQTEKSDAGKYNLYR